MKFLRKNVALGLICILSSVPLSAAAQTSSVPPLVIREIKVTGEEFVVLQATEDIPDLSIYWIGYASSDTVSPGAVLPSQQLPARPLGKEQAVLLTSDSGSTCDAVYTAKLSVSLADTKGTFAVRLLENSGLSSTFTTIDSVNWAKPAATAVTTALLDVRKETTMLAYPVWYHDPAFVKPWRLGNLAGCELTLAPVSGSSSNATETVSWQQSALEPPAIIEALNEVEMNGDGDSVPSENATLAPPIITEILPNPLGTGNDASDEYIELYNSNDAQFDLGGFTLQTGLATKHAYTLPAGTTILPNEFKVFYAAQTGLSMSNTSGQVTLLDRSKGTVAQSDPYDSAPDGQAWALANGTWYWTTKTTPATTNIINQPILKPATGISKLSVKAASTSGKKSSGAVKSAATKKAKATKTKTAANKQKAATTPVKQTAVAPRSTSIHPGVLALFISGGVGYGAYVYRKDMANAFYKLRRH